MNGPASNGTHPRFTLPTFEGPLDLLLQLIRENQVDIYDIPIAEITRQYLERLAQWRALDLTIAGEYLVMAATLLEIKSRMLLPKPATAPEEDEDPRTDLVERLLEYQRYLAALETFREWEAFRQRLFFRATTETIDDYVLPYDACKVRGEDLARILRRLLENAGVDTAEPVSAIVPRQRTNLRMKMAEILRALRGSLHGCTFGELVIGATSRLDVVMAFLALLELLRRGKVKVTQRRSEGPIHLCSVDIGEEPGPAISAELYQ